MRGALLAAVAAALFSSAALGATAKDTDTLRPLVDLIETVRTHYVGDAQLHTKGLINEALKGMVAGLDRYSEYLDQQRYKDLQDDTRGSFNGVGIAIGIVSDKLMVIAPIEGTPADRAGLQGGDVIAYIDGFPTDGIKIMDAVHRIKGPRGTKVTLTIFREGEPPRDVVLKRAKITPVNIRAHIMDGIGYVAIRSFPQHTADKLSEVLESFQAAHVEGVILDLRRNPGGLLKEAYRVADLFLPGDKLIVSTEGRDPEQTKKHYSTDKQLVRRVPLVVLTSEHSASASEIVAGALQDWGRAVIMGRRTFGKASVQSIQPISSSRAQALRMTVARYYTPQHNKIHEIGIQPDVTLLPQKYSPTYRRLRTARTFTKFAATLNTESAAWLDPSALREGRLTLTEVSGGPDRTEDRLAEELHNWINAKGPDVSDATWDEVEEKAVQQVRLAVMRKIKGEEAAKRMAVQFDLQVGIAAKLLRLAAAHMTPQL